MDPSQEECRRCRLYIQKKVSKLERMGDLLAWSVYRILSSPSVERFGLHDLALASLNLRLTPARSLELIANIDAILEGVADAKRELAPPKKPGAS